MEGNAANKFERKWVSEAKASKNYRSAEDQNTREKCGKKCVEFFCLK